MAQVGLLGEEQVGNFYSDKRGGKRVCVKSGP